MMFIAVPGLALSTFLIAFAIGGLWETPHDGEKSRIGGPLLLMCLVAVCTSLILIEPAAISPLWLQYLLLIGAPAVVGFVIRHVIAIAWGRRNSKGND